MDHLGANKFFVVVLLMGLDVLLFSLYNAKLCQCRFGHAGDALSISGFVTIL